MVKPIEVAETFTKYCKNLYDNLESEYIQSKTQEFLTRLHHPLLSGKEATEMTWPISLQEISSTIKALKNNKSLGFINVLLKKLHRYYLKYLTMPSHQVIHH